jgi:hypothetical protein
MVPSLTVDMKRWLPEWGKLPSCWNTDEEVKERRLLSRYQRFALHPAAK